MEGLFNTMDEEEAGQFMENSLKQFWENGYMILPSAIESSIIQNALNKIMAGDPDVTTDSQSPLEFRKIFLKVNETFDDKRLQAPLPKGFAELKRFGKKLVKAFNMRWKPGHWVVLKSLPGGEEQDPHRDFCNQQACPSSGGLSEDGAGRVQLVGVIVHRCHILESTLGITQRAAALVEATIISEVDIAKIDAVTNGTAANKALVLDTNLNVSGVHALSASELTGAAQASKALIVDENRDIDNIHALTADELTETLQSRDQPLIHSVGVLDSLDVAGDVTVGYQARHRCTRQPHTLPLEIGCVPYTFTGSYAYGNDANAHGQGTRANYSLRADGRILVTGDIEVMSDRRLKMNIANLDPAYAKKFVKTTEPVRFNW
ncbi:hypothetical protein PHYBOEH_005579 [Phytophthora boehmeriae]|uniref:Uncharacterized protein n=1 Tax=Phytophthora boehmeriae TaxID=109152 RepID=A0A8T1WLK2_9STRA|nr:hypothetical protein PHYBOEH_005579 [Phytophthora boehmeriae]